MTLFVIYKKTHNAIAICSKRSDRYLAHNSRQYTSDSGGLYRYTDMDI